MTLTTLALVIAAMLVLIGIAGTVLPILPGTILIFVGLLLAAWAEDFAYVGAWTLVAAGVLALLAQAVDVAASAVGAQRYGASRRAIIGTVIGSVIGLFFGLPGIMLGPFIGAVAGELSGRRGWADAGRAGLGTAIGLALGAAAKLALAFTMVGLYALDRWVWGAA